ncbi:RNase H domain-containing protein [Trichonephila clavipes]|nr:RNase H domain-containing protein [Trichonephila clavipes]
MLRATLAALYPSAETAGERERELDKICFLQWLPAHVDIAANESADRLAKEARNLNNDNFVNITLLDANAVANFKLREKYQICNISGNRLITITIARLRTGHYRGMKFDRVSRRYYRNCDKCLDIELTPAHIFDCPSILAALQKKKKKKKVLFSSTNLYVDNIEEIAKTLI